MADVPRSFLFLLGSSREGGNTEALARAAAEHLSPADEQRWLDLAALGLPQFTDRRHAGEGVTPPPEGPVKTAVDATLAATDLVIVSPLYWYSVSAPVKTYLDYWSGWMRVPGLDFRARMAGRRLWGVTVWSGDEPEEAEPLAGTLRLTAEYMRMPWQGVLLGRGNQPGDLGKDAEALRAAKTFFAGGTEVPGVLY